MLLTGLGLDTHAQAGADAVADAIGALRAAAGSELDVRRSQATGLATFLSVKRGGGIPTLDASTPQERALAFVEAYGSAFGIADPSRVRVVRATPTDERGMDHVRLQQVVGDVPVVGGEMLVHLRGSRVLAANGKTLPGLDGFDTNPAVAAAGAEEAARRLVERRLRVAEAELSEPRLEILNRGVFDGRWHPTDLVWFVEATGPALREYIWVDARRGGVVLHFSQLDKARNRSIYSASGGSSLPGSLIGTEAVPPVGDGDAVAAFNFSGDTYDYFFNEHGRDSYDDAGASLVSTVHFCPGAPCPYQNAFWNGVQMVYGEGFSRADDVDAHELTHAVTEYSAGLYYYMQSGALNESFSDIFGETVDLWNTPLGDVARRGNDAASARWLIGEDIPGIGAFRNMMNPNAFGDPGKTSDTQYYCGFADNGGVHVNSGVPNHAYALMVDGGTFNGITVTGMGLTKAAKIQYRVLTQYLVSASDFLDVYDAAPQACSDLIGTAGITASDCEQVRRAMDAVQMAAPALCLQSAVPEFCPAGKAPSNLFFDDFESGLGSWSLSTVSGPAAWSLESGYATSGTQMLFGENVVGPFPIGGDSRASMSSSVAIPAGDVRMHFNHAYELDFEAGWDGGVVEYSTDGGANWSDAGPLMLSDNGGHTYDFTIHFDANNPLADRPAFSDASSGYTATQLDLSPLAGQNVRFRFRLGTDECCTARGWFIDDVRLYQCVDAGVPTLRVEDVTVREGDSGTKNAVFTVALSAPVGGIVSVDYATSNGTATAGSDYTARSGTLAISAGDIAGRIQVPVLGDTSVEGDETFHLTLSNPAGATIADAAADATIVENDGVPQPPAASAWSVARQGMSTQLGLAYGAGVYVSVGDNGDVWTSPTGTTWTQRSVPAAAGGVPYLLYGVTYGGGQFVAVGSCCGPAFADAVILTSPDGITWTERDANNSTTLRGVAHSGTRYVAVGLSGVIRTSLDGVSWSPATSGTGQRLRGIAYGGGAFVAVGDGPTILRSTDGLAWSPQTVPVTVPSSTAARAITHTGTQFVAVGAQGTVLTSPDGVTWTHVATGLGSSFESVASGGANGLIAVANGRIAASATGASWAFRSLPLIGPGGSKTFFAAGYGPSGFVAAGGDGALMTSTTGLTWVNRQLPASRYMTDVSHDGTRYCAVGSNGAVASSPDGSAWTNQTSVPAFGGDDYLWWEGVARGPTLFVAVGDDVMTSPDCVTWTRRSVSVASSVGFYSFLDVAHGGGRYVAVGYKEVSGGALLPMLATSSDGVAWADRDIGLPPGLYLSAVGYGGGRFVAVGESFDDGAPVLLTSDDGQLWEEHPASAFGVFPFVEGVTYLDGAFVAVNSETAWTSPDGIAWSEADLANLTFWWGSGASAGESRVLSVGAGGAWQSLDGNFWTPQTLPSQHFLEGAAYGPALDRFVAVGDSAIVYSSDPMPSLAIADVSLAEGAGPATLTVTLSAATGRSVTVQYATANGTAVAPADYAATSGTLTFEPGETSQTFSVPIVADAAYEPHESLTVALSAPAGASLPDPSALVTIQNDDPLPVISVNDVTVTETDAGTVNASFSVTLAGATNVAATVAYATANGTATAPADFTAKAGVLTFAPGVTAQTVVVAVAGDTLDEADETFALDLSSPTQAAIGDGAGTGTITDNDSGGLLQFGAATYGAGEAGMVTITVTRTGGAASGVTVQYATSNGTATAGSDYTAKAGTLTFGAGVLVQSFTVPILADTFTEGPETVTLTLSNPTGGSGLGAPATAPLTIRDDDLGGALRFSLAAYTMGEAGPAATIVVTRANGSAGAVTVDYATSNGTATAGSDYTATSGTLSFAAGILSRTFTIPILNDTTAEPAETVNLSLSTPTGGGYLGSPATAVLTITDNEPVVQFSLAAYKVTETGPTATIVATRTGGPTAFTVDYATSNGTATAGSDYTAASGTLTFAAGILSRTFTIPILNDTLGEGPETVNLALSNAVGALIGARSTAVLTITDNEPVVQFSLAAYTVAESASTATIVATRTGAGAFTVDYATSNGTATAGSDYTAASGTLTFAAATASQSFTIPIANDTLGEGPETVNLALSNAVGALIGTRSTAVLTITDNEPVVQFSLAAYTVAETAPTVTIAATRTGGTAAFTVDYATSNGTATAGSDYTAASGTLSFAAGVMSRTFTIPIANDTLDEASETVNLALSNAVGAFIGPRGAAVLTITDNDNGGTLAFGAPVFTVGEAGPLATLTVTRTGTSLASGVTVDYATSNGTATAGSDYTASSGTLAFAAGETSQTFTVPVADDAAAEGSETVLVTLSGPAGGGSLGAQATATLVIVDSEVTLQFSAASYSVSEAGANATITVTRAGPAGGTVGVSYATSAGTASAGADYTERSGVLSFGPGVTTLTFTVPIANDTADESDETVNLALSAPTGGASLGPRSAATLVIVDNDVSVQVAAPAGLGEESTR